MGCPWYRSFFLKRLFKKSEKMGDKEGYSNVFWTAIQPYNFNYDNQLAGAATVVASEVLVGWVIRKVMKAPKPVLEMAYIHALSLPFLGGLSGYQEDPSFRTSVPGGAKAGETIQGYGHQLAAGAKGIPAVILAQYIVASFTSGFHVPWFNLKDILITAAAKAVTAPLLFALSESMPESLADGLEVMQQLVEIQAASSVLTSKDKRATKKAAAMSVAPSVAAARKQAWEAAKSS